MYTWYLFLGFRPEEQPWILRRCRAATIREAASIFAKRLNTTGTTETYTEAELLDGIKREDELTATKQHWIAATLPEVLDF